MKRGILEVSDMCIINKADGDMLTTAKSTLAEYKSTSQFWRTRGARDPPVLLASACTGAGMREIWNEICKFRLELTNQELSQNRIDQAKYWTSKRIQDLIVARMKSDGELSEKKGLIDDALSKGTISPRTAARQLLEGTAQSFSTSN